MERRTTSHSQHVYADGITPEILSRHTILGRARTLRSVTKWEWMFLGLSLAGLVAAAILTLYRIIHPDATFSQVDFTFSLLLLLNIGFSVLYVVHGIMKERAYEILVFSLTIVIVLLYCVLNYTLSEHRGYLKLGRLVLVCALGPVLVGCGLYFTYSYYTSNYLVYRTVGANTELQKMCRKLILCSTLLKFDLQLQASMLILVLENGNDISVRQTWLLGAGLAVTVAWITVGFLANKYEKMSLAAIFFVLSLFEPAYLLYKMSIVNQKKNPSLTSTTLSCGVLGLVVWVLSIVVMFLVVGNYGKGLREKVYERSGSGTPQQSKGNSFSNEESSSPAAIEQAAAAGGEAAAVSSHL